VQVLSPMQADGLGDVGAPGVRRRHHDLLDLDELLGDLAATRTWGRRGLSRPSDPSSERPAPTSTSRPRRSRQAGQSAEPPRLSRRSRRFDSLMVWPLRRPGGSWGSASRRGRCPRGPCRRSGGGPALPRETGASLTSKPPAHASITCPGLASAGRAASTAPTPGPTPRRRPARARESLPSSLATVMDRPPLEGGRGFSSRDGRKRQRTRRRRQTSGPPGRSCRSVRSPRRR
jgi:hypothetical protein